MISFNGFRFLPGPLSSDSIRAQINQKLTKESAREQKIGTRKSKIPCARQQNYLRARTKRPTKRCNTKHTSKRETTRTSKCETKHTSKCKTTRTSKHKTTHTSKHNNKQAQQKTTQNTKTRLDRQMCYRRSVVVVWLSSFCCLQIESLRFGFTSGLLHSRSLHF